MSDRSRRLVLKPYTYTKNIYLKNGVDLNTNNQLGEYNIRDITDTSTPDFHQKMKNGEIVNNPCGMLFNSQTRDKIGVFDFNVGSTEYRFTGSPTLKWQSYGPGHIGLGAVDDTDATAKLRAIARMDNTPTAMLEDLFEIRQTLKFLRNPLDSLFSLSKAFQGEVNKISKVRARADAIAQVWLTYRFAFTPLVRSALDIAHQLGAEGDNRPLRRSSVGRTMSSAFASDSKWGSACEYARQSKRTFEVKAGVNYSISNSARDWRHNYGLRNKDIPLGLWAVMPYSFMIDRIADISSGIEGLTNLLDPSLTINFGYITKKENREQSFRFIHQNGIEIIRLDSDLVTLKRFQYSRVPWAPGLSDVVPPINLTGLVNTVTKVIDLVALILRNMK